MQMGAGYWGALSRNIQHSVRRNCNASSAKCAWTRQGSTLQRVRIRRKIPVLQLQRPRSECHETQQVCPLRRDRKAKPAEPREMKEVVIAGDQPNLVINAGLRN